MKAKDFAELMLLGLIWGASFMMIKWAAPEFGVFLLVEIRALGATLLLIPFVWFYKQQSDLINFWPKLLVVGLLNTAIPFCLFNYGMMHLEAGLGAILNGTAPMFGIIVAYLFLKEKIGVVGLIGVLLGFAGVVLISYEQTSGTAAGLLPIIALLVATLCYGLATVYIKSQLSHAKPFAIAAGSQFFTALILLPIALFNLPDQLPSAKASYSALILAFVCTGLAYVLYFDLIAKIGASKALIVGYLVPLFGVIWGYIVLNESLSIKELGGGALILLGVVLATNVLSNFKRKAKLTSTV